MLGMYVALLAVRSQLQSREKWSIFDIFSDSDWSRRTRVFGDYPRRSSAHQYLGRGIFGVDVL